ncbi:uncharacterized protein LKV04_021483 isoform 2-T2 [Tautogolabrus adspersus]
MFDGNPSFQRILRLGLRAELESKEEIYEVQDVSQLPIQPSEYLKAANWSSDGKFIGKYTRPASVVDRDPYFTTNAELPPAASVEDQTKERNPEKNGRLLQEAKQYASKAERKRLKKQKQKEKKQLEKLDKEKPSPGTNEDGEDGACKPESKQLNYESNNSSAGDRQLASAKDTDSSDGSKEESSDEDGDTEEDSGNFEELDMTSTFVSKAADIARRKMEQKPEKREKKKSPVKEDSKSSPSKTYEDAAIDKKDSVATSSLTFEDNIKISTDLANTGNRFASTGDYSMAVTYFTDAIKYNPTEFKLFGNRSFCFEKMQEYEKALADAELSLSMSPCWVKGLFRKGRALAGLKRYDEASQAFRDVLRLEGSYAEAAQELMRVQITQLMGFGFTREQSSNALILHGTVEKALKVLSKLNNQPGPVQNGALPAARLVNVRGVSPVLSATNPAPHPPQSHNAPKTPLLNNPLVPVQNMSNVQSQPQPVPNQAPRTYSKDPRQPQELFPIWVGNLFHPLTESDLKHLFNKAGVVHSVKLLSYKRCAFVNYTKQEYCDEAIRRFHGFDLNGANIAVRYPDRIPHGIGISKSAIKAEDLQDEYTGYEYGRSAVGRGPPFRPYRPVPDYRGNYQY